MTEILNTVWSEKEEQMVMGYWEGRKTCTYNMPEIFNNKSLAWKHGWVSGRDDAFGKPSDKASVRKARAEMILGV